MDIEKVREDIRRLYSMNSAREGKYVRNMNRYMNNGVRRESVWTMNTAPQAYVTPAQGVEGTQTQINLIKSCIDSVTSRISQANVRPFFNPVNGNYDTQDACQTAQHFFDLWLDEQHAYPKAVMCFRDAATFDIGVMYVNPLTKAISRVAPWEYFIDPAEYYHGAVTRVMVIKKYYPLASLIADSDSDELKEIFDKDPHAQGEFATYYDLYGGEVFQFFDYHQVIKPQKLTSERYGGLHRRPFVEMFYTKPMRGLYSVSLADDLYPIQRQIDELVRRLDQATRKALLNMIFVPRGSGIKASNLENGVTAYEYAQGPDGGTVTVATPPAINDQFLRLLEMYMEKAYQLAGISQLSAQSKKPAGLNSGKALETMEDIESDRFNTQLQQFTHFLVDVARVAIDVFPAGDPILPVDIGRGKLKWGDLRKQRDLFSVQFSAATSLSKDPEEKRNEIQFLMSIGKLEASDVPRLYQLPDLEMAYTLASSAANYVDMIINDAIKTGNMEYAETVDLQLLKNRAIGKLNQLLAADDDAKYVDRLAELLTKVMGDIKNINAVMNPQNAPPPPPSNPQDSTLNGIQIQSAVELAMSISRNELSPESGRAIMQLAFPDAPPQILDAVIQGAVKVPEVPQTALVGPASVAPTAPTARPVPMSIPLNLGGQ